MWKDHILTLHLKINNILKLNMNIRKKLALTAGLVMIMGCEFDNTRPELFENRDPAYDTAWLEYKTDCEDGKKTTTPVGVNSGTIINVDSVIVARNKGYRIIGNLGYKSENWRCQDGVASREML